jgi:hypothetical protein
VSVARSMPHPYAEARILYDIGQMHLAQGDATEGQEVPSAEIANDQPLSPHPHNARNAFQQALPIFRHLGARPYIDRTEQALREMDPETKAHQ